jgi:hypothetical protein
MNPAPTACWPNSLARVQRGRPPPPCLAAVTGPDHTSEISQARAGGGASWRDHHAGERGGDGGAAGQQGAGEPGDDPGGFDEQQTCDAFIGSTPLSAWHGDRLMRHLLDRLQGNIGFLELNIRTLWSLIRVRPEMIRDTPVAEELQGLCSEWCFRPDTPG